jgi:hypothetical protein
MDKKILSLFLVCSLLFPALALADEAEEVEEETPSYDVTSIKKGDPAPFDGVLLTPGAAAKIAVDKKFEAAECDLRVGYELHIQENQYTLMLDTKQVSIEGLNLKYSQMMEIKSAENDRLHNLVLQNKPSNLEPLLFAGGMTIGMAVALGIFAAAVQAAGAGG